MRFCFVFGCLDMGGTETLIVRMSRWLVENGHQVTVLTPSAGEMKSLFAPQVQVVTDGPRYEAALYGGKRAARELLDAALGGAPFDVFYAFSNDGLWIAAALANFQPEPAKCLAGVYIQGQYVIGPRVAKFPRLASIVYPAEFLFQNYLPESCRLYMNQAVKVHLESRNFRAVPGVIWPIPVDAGPFKGLRRIRRRGTIVSVGRLARMKEYNLWMIDVVDQLVSEGLDVRWEVYGDGPFRATMEEKIRARNLGDRVILKGMIGYADLPKAFADADVFVGMGTSLIEAGLAGVPAVVAGAYDTTGLSYGFLHDLPDYSCGETVDAPRRPAKDFIRQVVMADDQEYARLVAADREHANRFDLNVLMPRFMDLVEDAPFLKGIWRPSLRYHCVAAYRAAVQLFGRWTRRRVAISN